MSKSKRDPPSQDDINRLIAGLREIEEDMRGAVRRATEFKPGDLTPEEEEFVRQEGLNALNYVPQKTLKNHSIAFQKNKEKIPKRTEVTSQPKKEPERVKNTLKYIPQKKFQNHSTAFQKNEEKIPKRTEVMSRPKTDAERVQIERKERAQNFRMSLVDRFDGFAYGMFLLVILGVTVLLIDSYGWPMGIFSGLLMLAVLELIYRLYARQ
jgi:hypothetical protein